MKKNKTNNCPSCKAEINYKSGVAHCHKCGRVSIDPQAEKEAREIEKKEWEKIKNKVVDMYKISTTLTLGRTLEINLAKKTVEEIKSILYFLTGG
jgi:uncharacterized Zn finger protein (UPF0148 family)